MRAGKWGFTLIELLVVLALLVVVMLTAAPLARDWADSSHTRESRGKLEQAYGLAKALATRNPCGSRYSSALTIEAAHLEVAVQGMQSSLIVALPGDSASCSFLATHPNPQWTAPLPAGVSIWIDNMKAEEGTPLKLVLDNRGLPSSSTEFQLRKGHDANDETGHLH